MKIKEFVALTLKEGLQKVRQEMGAEAVILETHKLRKGGILGIGARDHFKIVAATGITVDSHAPGANGHGVRTAAKARPQQSAVAVEERIATAQAAQNSARSGTATLAPNAAARAFPATDGLARDYDLSRLQQELQELRDGMDAMRQAITARHALATPLANPLPNSPRFVTDILARLHQAEVAEWLALELVEKLPNLAGWNEQASAPIAEAALKDAMAARVTSAGPIVLNAGRVKTVALVGPTGVGKTTTIAKLAAHFALVEKKRVGLLTMDTYRIAAVEQLKTYSQIIDIPVKVAYNQPDLERAMREFTDCDLVLVDTAGRSQKNIMQVSELKSMLETLGCETHLVLNASTKERDLADQIEKFSHTGADRILFTKLDETTTYGTVYSAAVKSGMAVSYMTTGQKVPEDIEVANGAKLAAMVLFSTAPSH